MDFTDYVSTGDGMWAEGFKEGVYTDDTEMTIGLVCVPSQPCLHQRYIGFTAVSLVLCAHTGEGLDRCRRR